MRMYVCIILLYVHGLCVCMYVCMYVRGFDKAVPQSIHIAHSFYFLYPIMVTVFSILYCAIRLFILRSASLSQ